MRNNLALTSLLIATLMTCPGTYLHAQSADNPPSTATQPTSETAEKQSPDPDKNTDATTAQNKPKGKKKTDIFRPSEEISEDFAVPFPVDI